MPSHKHGATTGDGGAHTHTGVASGAGTHTHTGVTYNVSNNGSNQYYGFKGLDINRGRLIDEKKYDVLISEAGAHTHDVTINNSSNHTHTINEEGEGQAHSIMQPYVSVYMWKRVS